MLSILMDRNTIQVMLQEEIMLSLMVGMVDGPMVTSVGKDSLGAPELT